MKRIICGFFAILFVMCLLPVNAFAAVDTKTEIIQFEDGSYLVQTIEQRKMRASGETSGSAVQTFYNPSGVAEWKAVLTGSFTYTGSSATCKSASCSVSIYNSAWSKVSSSASKSGNKAMGTATVAEKLLGVTVRTETVDLTLSCDANGNLS